MTDYHPPSSIKSLSVLASNDPVESMKKSWASQPAHAELAKTSHVNRWESEPLEMLKKKPIEEQVVHALRTIYDPELPVNIYDLGLIYDIQIDEKNDVKVTMTLTAPGCPVAGTLPPEVERKIKSVPGVSGARVNLVWQPAWSREMMSESAQLELGL
jgi:FeS assembly SUF system protein